MRDYVIDLQSFSVQANSEGEAEQKALVYLQHTLPAQIASGNTTGIIEAVWVMPQMEVKRP